MMTPLDYLSKFQCVSTDIEIGPLHAVLHLPFSDESNGPRFRLSLHWDHDTSQVHMRLSPNNLAKLLELLEQRDDGGVEGDDFLFSLEMLEGFRASLTIVRPAQLFALQLSIAEIVELARVIRFVVDAPAEITAGRPARRAD